MVHTEDKLDFFIRRTEKDLDEIKDKVNRLWEFRMMLFGGSAVISIVLSVSLNVLLIYLRNMNV